MDDEETLQRLRDNLQWLHDAIESLLLGPLLLVGKSAVYHQEMPALFELTAKEVVKDWAKLRETQAD